MHSKSLHSIAMTWGWHRQNSKRVFQFTVCAVSAMTVSCTYFKKNNKNIILAHNETAFQLAGQIAFWQRCSAESTVTEWQSAAAKSPKIRPEKMLQLWASPTGKKTAICWRTS